MCCCFGKLYKQRRLSDQAKPLIHKHVNNTDLPNFTGTYTRTDAARNATLPILRYTGNNAGEAWEITSGLELRVQRSHFDIGACVGTIEPGSV